MPHSRVSFKALVSFFPLFFVFVFFFFFFQLPSKIFCDQTKHLYHRTTRTPLLFLPRVIFYRVVVVVRMGERKVLNKYIPPDFDPSKVPKGKRPADGQIKVRMMLPMSICCQTCGNFISKGTKFNSRKEDAKGETYLGLKIFRFYFRCPRCSGEIAMKTDPERSDYIGTFFRGEISFCCWKNVSRVKSVERSFACTRRAASRLFCSRGALF